MIPKKVKEKKETKNKNVQNDKKTPENNTYKYIWYVVIIAIIASFIIPVLNKTAYIDNNVDLSTFSKKYWSGAYSEILIDWTKAFATLSGSKTIEAWVEKQKRDIIILPENDSLKDLWLTNKELATKIEVKDQASAKFWSEMLPTIIGFILFFVIAVLLIGRMWGMANNAMTFGKSRARIYDKDKDKIMFTDVAWAEEEKEELKEVVDFLKHPKKYKDMGAKIPKWILLVWPPGTGKTLIARAVAWESDVPFLSISGSEFVEMFVWVGASRVRDLFSEAKKIAPAIIFIDEIDAIGKKRSPWMWGWHDEREQTLNQILTEMDGFDNDTSIIVMAATNRADVLDKALTRPGRFDRKVTINLPNLEDRVKILEVHVRNKKIAKNVDLRSVASQTVWFSWADLWNLINEAAILSARYNKTEIEAKIITEAFEKIIMWLHKKSLVMDDKEKKITAYHEVGHALVGRLCDNTDPVHKVSILPRWWALWVTWFLPEKDKVLVSKAKYLDELATLYGWRVAEEIFFWKDFITTWASNDIERATKIARDMVTRFWMDEEVWAENFAPDRIEWNYLWAEWSSKPFSEKTQEIIDRKVKEILSASYSRTKQIILDNKELHIKISEDLLKKEELTKEEFEAYFA